MNETENNGENVSEMFPKQEIKSVEATLSWNLFVYCPYCGFDFDLSDSPHDDDGYFSIPIFNNKWEEAEGLEAECPCCFELFTVSKIEY